MSLPPVARRSLALLATTTLLTSGAAGLFTGTAFAANAAQITSVSPAVTNNSGTTALTVTGANLSDTAPDAIVFALKNPSYYTAAGQATPTLALNQTQQDQAANSSSQYAGTLATTNAPPGDYDVYDVAANGTTDGGSPPAPRSGPGPKCVPPAGATACFKIGSSGAPDVTSVDTAPPTGINQTSRGPGAVDISGRNLAQASTPSITLPGGVADPKVSIKVYDPNSSSKFAGYTSSSLTRANIVASPGFVPGKHLVSFTNTVGETGAASEWWLPYFTQAGISQTAAGAGSTITLTVTGQGIPQGSTLGVQTFNDSNDPNYPACPLGCAQDASFGPTTVSPDGTTISVPIRFISNADTKSLRSVSISGPHSAGYTVPNAFKVTDPPIISSLTQSVFGQGASRQVTVAGTGFAVGTTAAQRPTFKASGTGITLTTLSSTNVQAVVQVDVAQDAPLADSTITATNPDGGTSTYSGSSSNPALTVAAGPKVTKVSPTSAAAGTTKTVTITGTTFDSLQTTNGSSARPTVQFSLPPAPGAARQPDGSVSVGTVTSTAPNAATGAPATLTFSLGIAGNAPAGLRDIVVTNPSDGGSFLCAGCFGVDSLTASPTTAPNTGTKQITFTAGTAIPSGSTVKLTKAGNATVQPDIAGGSVTFPTANSVSAIFDLTDAATGAYNGIVTTPSGSTFACSGCVTVTGLVPTFTSINPAGGGQGAVNRAATITGTNFSRGMNVTITDVTVHDVVFVSRTQLAVKIDIPTNAPTGTKDLVITNNDASQKSATATGVYTVSAPPTVSSVSPTNFGQGATGVKITVTGPGFVSGSTPDTTSKADFGPGVTVKTVTVTKGTPSVVPPPLPGSGTPDDTLVATVDIAQDAPATLRDVSVTNPDGGVGTKAQAFTVNVGPKVTGIAPTFLKPGGSGHVTITGTGFSQTTGKNAVPTMQGITLSNVVVVSPTSITADAAVDDGTAKGPIDVVVTNPTDSGAGTCTGCFFVATAPNPPVQVHTVSAAADSLTVGWTAPSDNGGAPVTSYVVSAKDSAGKPAGTPGTTAANAISGTVTGLASGVKYTISVIARNVAGDSTASTTLAQTTGTAAADTLLSSSHSPSLTTTGQSVTLFGKLFKSTGEAIPGATVELALAPDIGSASFPKVTTDAGGAWSYTFNPVYSYTIRTIYRGDANNKPGQATPYRMGVSTLVTRTSPANGARSSVKAPLVVRGGTSPNKGGNLITLYRYSGGRYIAIQNARVASNGTYAFSANLARGNYVLKVGIGRTSGNFVGYSPAFSVYRV